MTVSEAIFKILRSAIAYAFAGVVSVTLYVNKNETWNEAQDKDIHRNFQEDATYRANHAKEIEKRIEASKEEKKELKERMDKWENILMNVGTDLAEIKGRLKGRGM